MPESEHADKDGFVPVARLKLNKPGSAKSNPDGSIEFDTRERSMLDKMSQFVSGVTDKTSATMPM